MKKIAFIGIRGIPVVYSGFESFVEDLTSNLKSFAFFVYCRKRYVKKIKHNRVHLVYIPTFYLYKLETFIHSLLSSIHACVFLRPDVIFYLGVGNSPFLLIPRLFGIKTIINVDGMDWDREKWGGFGKWYLSLCAYISVHLADTVVTDSIYSFDYYKKQFNRETEYVPYMVNGYKWIEQKNVLKKYGLREREYFVWAGRLVPDNHLEDLITAFMSTRVTKKLVIIGDDSYQTAYLKTIENKMQKDGRIIHTGFLPRDQYLTLIKSSYAYIETKQSGGTHPTLLDALTYAPMVICNDFVANKNIANGLVSFYRNRDSASLKIRLEHSQVRMNKKKMVIFDAQLISDQYKTIFDS